MVFVLFLVLQLHKAFGTFGFDIHHRYSDPVKGTISDLHWLPQKGSIQYYSAWTQHDRHINRHRYTSTVGLTPNHRRLTSTVDLILLLLTFDGGNRTVLLSSLGFLHYAYVTVDTPGLSFLVALDTGSDLFWLPCNCNNCARTLITGSGRPIDLNIYSPNTSSISKIVPCNGTLWGQGRQCQWHKVHVVMELHLSPIIPPLLGYWSKTSCTYRQIVLNKKLLRHQLHWGVE